MALVEVSRRSLQACTALMVITAGDSCSRPADALSWPIQLGVQRAVLRAHQAPSSVELWLLSPFLIPFFICPSLRRDLLVPGQAYGCWGAGSRCEWASLACPVPHHQPRSVVFALVHWAVPPHHLFQWSFHVFQNFWISNVAVLTET
ncbi:uncharacterized protein LOC105740018 [Nomascus leucogenys]|uniref:uncharacterized protein LOC105740018 n=1 Tax=Nomascus leucogenys TaxID=61853 RepID=UPI00062ABE30|nr:uncharacterized protein LOC105740018 [Nomascus leucogenys]